MSEIDELARLHDLFVRGAITREEFAAMKAKIIVSSVTGKIENSQQATASITGNSVAYIIVGAICIGWIVTGLVEVAIGLPQYDLIKSRALAVGLIVAYVLPTALAARFLMRGKRNVILGVCVLVADAILLSAAMLLFHFGD
jgi:hypothetical protein